MSPAPPPCAASVTPYKPEAPADLSERARAIESWSGRVRSFRRSAEQALIGHDVDALREELGVAEEELRSQHDELVTARLAAELEREQYRQLFESAPVPYIITDPAGTIHAPNAAAASLLGVDSSRLVGKPLPVFIDVATRVDFRTELAKLVASGEASGNMRVRVMTREGLAHDAICVIGVVRDSTLRTTELRWLIVPETLALRAERERLLHESERARVAAEDANLAKTQLLATVSHELRTPLTAIGGYSELLALGLRGPLEPQQLEDIQRIQRAQHHMTTLLDDLLLYFRLGLGGLTATVRTAAIAEITKGLNAFVAPQATQRRISLAIDVPTIEAGVLADVDRCRQILINLLTNAVKFAPPDTQVEMRVLDEADVVRVEVQDHGPGIAPDRLESVFEPFVQLDAGSGTRGGFGLGLAISRKLAELMGGSLTARSAPEEGSCFVLTLRKSP
jgi:PAS domain S-box-containing protein